MEIKPKNFQSREVVSKLEFEPDIDLMASRVNKQLDRFMSFRPDPEALANYVFAWPWEGLRFYCFPPFACISKFLEKLSYEKTSGILITPNWPNQVWFPINMSMALKTIDIPYREDLLLHPLLSSHQMSRRLHLQAHFIKMD